MDKKIKITNLAVILSLVLVFSVFAVSGNFFFEKDVVDSISKNINKPKSLVKEIKDKSEKLSKLGIDNWDLESEYGFSTQEVKIIKEQLKEDRKKNLEKVELADIKGSYDKKFAKEYLDLRNYFSDIRYEEFDTLKKKQKLTIRNKLDNVKGYKIKGKGYAIELLACNSMRNSCAFRVNGVPTGRIYQKSMSEGPTSFDLGNGYSLVVNSIEFNKCDYKVCDYTYDVYDEVEIGVEKR